MDLSETLKAKQTAHNEYSASVVVPLLGLSADQMDGLGFAETAKRISDDKVRSRYCELAVDLLDANIAYYRSDATAMSMPERSNSAVVVSTLLASAIAYHFGGPTVALIAAAAWYGLANETAYRAEHLHVEKVKAHNELVPDWAETVKDWEVARDQLRSL